MKRILLSFLTLILLLAGVYFSVRKSHRNLLIVGCARSGTSYIATVLERSNFEIKHEKMGKEGASSWYLAAKPNYRKRRVNLSKFHFDHVFHQVRDPLSTISSVYFSENTHSWNYILRHCPEIKFRDSHLVKCAKYWYYWNLKAEKTAEWTYRVEDIDLVWDEFSRRIGKNLSRDAIELAPKNINTRGEHKLFSWKDLQRELDPELYRNITQLALRYGYTIAQEDL